MKLSNSIFLSAVFIMLFSACEKDTDGNGNILVTVKYNGQAVSQASIYLKRGNDTTTTIPPAIFDKQIGADAVGQAYFENLTPDTYTIFAKGYSQQKSGTVTGKTTTTVVKRFRQNQNDVTINTN